MALSCLTDKKVLEMCILSLFDEKPNTMSFQVLAMSSLHWMCERKEELQNCFQELLVDRVRGLRHFFRTSRSGDSKEWMRAFVKEVKQLCLFIKRCGVLFPSVVPQAVLLYQCVCEQDILRDKKILEKLKKSLLFCVNTAEEDESAKSIVYELVLLFSDSVSKDLLNLMLENTFENAFYPKYYPLAKKYFSDHSVCEYIRWVETTIDEVKEKWILPSSEKKEEVIILFQNVIDRSLNKAFFYPFRGDLMYSNTGFISLINSDEKILLKSFIYFYCQRSGNADLLTALQKSIMKKVQSTFSLLHSDPAKVVELILNILETSSHLFQLLDEESPEEEILSELNKKGFAEAFSSFYDKNVKRMIRGNSILQTIGRIEHLVTNKEALDRALRNTMLVRLASAKASNLVVERHFLSGLPEGRTAQLECLIRDVEESWELSKKFVFFAAEEGEKLNFQFVVTILRGAAVFPLVENATSSSSIVPPAIKKCEDRFLFFYSRLHNGRQLKFLYNWGKAKIHFYHNEKNYVIIAPISLTSLLFMFNSDTSYTPLFLADQCGMELSTVGAQLHLLQLSGLIVKDENKYKFNESFFAPRPLILLSVESGSVEEDCNVQSSSQMFSGVSENEQKLHGAALECAIMKIMKSNSLIKEAALFKSVSLAVKHFDLNKSLMKETLSNLIERGFIIRSRGGYAFHA